MPGPIKLFRTIPQTLQQSFTSITGGLPSRTTASISFTLAPNAEGTDVITLAPAFTIFGISVGGKKCRVRLYSTAAFRLADATRGITVPPTPGTNHGCVLDLYLNQVSQVDPWTASPAADGFNQDTPVTSVAYIAVKNYDSISQTITVTFTYVPIEALAS